MKIKSFLMCLITIFALLLADTVKANSEAPSTFLIDSKNVYLINGAKYLNGEVSLYYKENTNGTIVYCTEVRDLSVSWGKLDYNLSKELDARYAYVIENGYPNKSITGDKNKDYFITALAVWYLSEPNDLLFGNFNFDNGTHFGKENDVAKYVAELIRGANNYSYVNPTIKINGSTNEFKLSSDKKYYITGNLGVTTTGTVGNYTVSLENAPSGTIVTDVNGNEKNTFGTGEKFIVKVPVSSLNSLSSEFKVSVNANGSIKQAYLYEPVKSNFQNVAVIYPKNSNLSDTTNLKLNLTTKVEISKVDATTSEEIPGATLTIKNSKGEVVKTWVSTNKPEVIENLPVGKYTLTEKLAPEGYVLSTETVTFEVKSDGTVTKVKMENKREEKTPIYISKQDITTNEELAGAHLELRNQNGDLVEAWVSTDTPHMIEKLNPGKYFLTEILAPEGYELSSESVEFTVKEDGTVDGEIIMYNEVETVEVPNTSSFKNITTSLIGIIVIGLGSMIIYKNYKKNEEY